MDILDITSLWTPFTTQIVSFQSPLEWEAIMVWSGGWEAVELRVA